MKKVVERERNKTYYRLLHWPIWVWVFFILPGHLTHDLFVSGPRAVHWAWLGLVAGVTGWRAWLGRLPGCEFQPYVTHWGVHQPNLWYRVVCYTAAWIDLLVPFTLNLAGLVVASSSGQWMMDRLYAWLYFPLALAIVAATALDATPRTRRSTLHEGAERAWFYVAIWTVVPTQAAAWAAWRLGGQLGIERIALARVRLGVFLACTALFFLLGLRGRLPRTARYHARAGAEPILAPGE
jgi:hypothetical protein